MKKLIIHTSQNYSFLTDLYYRKEEICFLITDMPIKSAIEEWEILLVKGGEFATYSDIPILIGQWLVRNKKIDKMIVIYHKSLEEKVELKIDSEGDFIEDIPGGFFGQRMKYLR